MSVSLPDDHDLISLSNFSVSVCTYRNNRTININLYSQIKEMEKRKILYKVDMLFSTVILN